MNPESVTPVPPSLPEPSRRRRHSRLAWVIAAGVIAAGLVCAERMGWPWLVKPVAGAVGELIGRRVEVGGGERARLHLWGGVRFEAPSLAIGGPQGAPNTWLLRMEGGELGLSYPALWRMSQGAPIDIQRLRARRLEAWLTRPAGGQASWQMGGAEGKQGDVDEGDATQAWRDWRVQELELTQGVIHVDDEPLRVRGTLGVSVLPAGDQAWHWAATGEGEYLGQPAAFLVNSVSPWGWSGERSLKLRASAGRARFAYQGAVGDQGKMFSGRFDLSGPSLAAVGQAVGVTLPTTAAFRMSGDVRAHGDVTQVRVAQARIGRSQLSGRFVHDRGQQPPLLTGELRGSRLMLADLGPAVGVPASTAADAPEPRAQRVLPDRPFNLPSLKAMNADVGVAIEEFDTGNAALQAMRDLRARVLLTAGVLKLDRLSTTLAQGRVAGQIELDARQEQRALLSLDLRVDGVEVAKWAKPLQRDGRPPYLAGVLSGHLKARGQGRSTAEMLGSIDGRADLVLQDGQVSHLGIELAGLDVMEGLFQWVRGDEILPIACAQLQWTAKGGVLRPDPVIVSTDDSTLWVDGQVSLKDETLDLRSRVAPKDFSLVALRTPVRLRGPWQDVDVQVLQTSTWARLIGAAALASVHPLAGLVPLVDGGQREAARVADLRCRQASAKQP